MQELVEERDNLEKQLSQLTSLLGQVEEKRLSTIKDMENMKVEENSIISIVVGWNVSPFLTLSFHYLYISLPPPPLSRWSMHGKVLRDKYTDSLDSGKYLHAKACNRARRTVNWLAIAFWELVFASPAHLSPAEASFFGTNSL